jgi:hypothetical protein
MTTQEQAYINGFVKRASEYGLNQNEAIELLKQAYGPMGGSFGAYGGMGVQPGVSQNLNLNDPTLNRPGTAPTQSPAPAAPNAMPSRGAILSAQSPAPAAPSSSLMPSPRPSAGPGLSTGGNVSLGIGGVSAAPAAPNPALLNAVAPSNTFGGNTQLGLNGKSSPAPAAAAPAAQAGPSNAYLAKVMGSYNPNSALDQRKANAIRQAYQPGMSANQIYANKGYQAASQRR